MSNNIDLKKMWGNHITTIPDKKEIFEKADKLKKENRKKSIYIIFLLSITISIILYIVFSSNLVMLTTKIGTILVIISILLAILNSTKNLLLSNPKNTATDNKTYLSQLIKLKQQHQFTQTIIMKVYFVLLSTGLALYMIEPTSKMSTSYKILSYLLTFCWISFAWFYIRPKRIAKEQSKLNEVIERLTLLNNDMTEPE